MPSGLFRKDGDRYVFSGPTPPSFAGYDKDHRELLVRYIFQLTPEEQRKVSSQMPKGGTTKSSRVREVEPTARAGGSR
jgi:hypothetical protein